MDGDVLQDRISALQDEILQLILCPLSITEKAKTSVLSRRWQYLWLSTPVLEFDDCIKGLPEDEIKNLVDRCLHHSISKLQTFSLDLSFFDTDKISETLLSSWIRRANERSVSKLHLSFGEYDDYDYDQELPSSIFQCRYLTKLALSGCPLRLPASRHLNNLTRLGLFEVDITNDALALLLSSCILLEHLFLGGLHGPTHIKISRRCCRLKSLIVIDLPSSSCVLIESAPVLSSFEYCGDLSRLFMKNVPCLAEAKLYSNTETPHPLSYEWKDLLPEFSCIKILSVNVTFYHNTATKGKPHHLYMPRLMKRLDLLHVQKSLKELHLCGISLEESSLCDVLDSLQHLASLQNLCLCLAPYLRYFGEHRVKGKSQVTCLELRAHEMRNIKTVTVTEFAAEYHELQWVNFVLGFAEKLESLSLNIREGNQIGEKLQKEILQTPRVSRNARVTITEVPDDEPCPRQSELWS